MALGSADDVIVKFGADISGLSSGIKDAQGQVEGFGSSIKSLGSGVTTLGLALTAGITVPLVALGALALKSSSDVGGAFNEIQRNTGATGATLDGLKQSFTDVFKTVPVDAHAAGDAIAYLNMKLGDTGPQLTAFTTELVNLSRITGTDLTADVHSAGDAFAAWHVATADQIPTLNELWRIAVAGAMPIGTLLDELQQYAPMLQQMNMPLEKAALFIGSLSKAGIDAGPVLNGLRTWMGKVATETNKANESLATGKTSVDAYNTTLNKTPHNFEDLYNSIKNAKTEQEGYNIAVEAFGARSAPAMTKAIRENTLNLADFKKIADGNKDTIDTMADKTTTWSDALKVLKQNVELAAAPIGVAMGSALKNAVGNMTPLVGLAQNLGVAFSKLPEPVKETAVVIGAVAASIGPALMTIGTFASHAAQGVAAIAPAFTVISREASKAVGFIASIPGHIVNIVSGAATAAIHFGEWVVHLAIAAGHLAIIAVQHIASIVTGAGTIAEKFVSIAMDAAQMVGNLANVAISLITSAASAGVTAVSLVSAAASSIIMVGAFVVLGGIFLAVGVALAMIVGYFALAMLYSQTFRDTLSQVILIVQQLGGHLQTAFSDLMAGKVTEAVNELKLGFGQAYDSLKKIDWKTTFNQVGADIKTGLQTALKTIGDIWNNTVKPALTTALNAVNWNDVGKTFGTLLANAITIGLQALAGVFTGDWSGLEAAINSLFGGGGGGGKSLNETMLTTIGTGPSNDFAEAAKRAVQSFVDGFKSALQDKQPEIAKAIADAVQAAAQNLPAIAVDVAFDITGIKTNQTQTTSSPELQPKPGETGVGDFVAWLASLGTGGASNNLPGGTISLSSLLAGVLSGGGGGKTATSGGTSGNSQLKVDIVLDKIDPKIEQLIGSNAAPFTKAFDLKVGTIDPKLNQLTGGDPAPFIKAINISKGTIDPKIDQLTGGNPAPFTKAINISKGTVDPKIAQLIGDNSAPFNKAVDIKKGAFDSPLGQIFGENAAAFTKAVDIKKGNFDSPMGQIFGIDASPFTKAVNIAAGSFASPLGQIFGVDPTPFTKAVNLTTGTTDATMQKVLGGSMDVTVNFKTGTTATNPGGGTAATQHGAIIPATRGGQLILAGEGGEREAVVPEHLWGKPWGHVLSAISGVIPHMQGGGIIGSAAGLGTTIAADVRNFVTSVITKIPTATDMTSSAVMQSEGATVQYNAYISMDSENIKRDVFQAFRELENYHHLTSG